MAKPAPSFSLDSPGVRIRRLATPRETMKAIARLGASLAVAIGATALASLVHDGVFIAFALLTALGFALAALAALPLGLIGSWTALAAIFARARPGVVSVGANLVVERSGDVQSFAPSDVVAIDTHEHGAAAIRMEDGDVVRVQVMDDDEAARLAEAIAAPLRPLWVAPLFPPEPPKEWPRRTLAVLAFVAGIVGLALGTGVTSVALFVGCAGLVLWLTVLRPEPAPRRLRIGSDGIAVRSATSLDFIPFAKVERIEPAPNGAVLTLRSGDEVRLPVVPPARSGPGARTQGERGIGALRRTALLDQLERGLRDAEIIAGEERLARQGRSIDAWRDAVRELVRHDAPGYRAALLPTEQAVRIVESGRAAPEARVGAALALAPSADAALKQRVRIALESTADESTRIAIIEALEDQLESWRLERLADGR